MVSTVARNPFDDMDDYEMERSFSERQERMGSGTMDDLLTMAIVVFIVVGLVLAGLGWLDAQFGWGLKDWLVGVFQELFKN